MPADSGMIFVVILHLSPEHESMLPAVLAKETATRVVSASQGMKVEANNVYVIPPGKHLVTVNGHLRLDDLDNERGLLLAALTGLGRENDRKLSKEAGFDAHLVKPVDMDTLLTLFAGRTG